MKSLSSPALVTALALIALAFTPATLADAPHAAAPGRVVALFFYSETCKECLRLKTGFLPRIEAQYGKNLIIEYLEVSSPQNYQALLAIEQTLQKEVDQTPPLMIVGNDVLAGESAIHERLAEVIDKYRRAGGCSWPEINITRGNGPRSLAIQQLKGLSWAAVIGGGLLDGINPCAFTTVIFLVSYLALLGRTGQELILPGLNFIAGVFVSYFLIGLGLLELLRTLPGLSVASRSLSWLVASLCGLLALLSLLDYVRIRKGRVKNVTLRLSKALKQSIHALIRRQARRGAYLTGTFVIGLAVALLEFPCTGQVYLPVVFILRQADTAGLRVSALVHLLLYDFLFILPLSVIFVLTYLGTTSKTLAGLVNMNLSTTKFLTACFFLVCAATVALLG